MKKFISIFCIIIALLISCNKKVASYNADFIGKWRTATVSISTTSENIRSEIIIEEADGAYNNSCKDDCGDQLCDCLSTQAGRAVISFDKKRIKIGSSNTLTLTIDKEPYQDVDGNWIVEIGGLLYYKQ